MPVDRLNIYKRCAPVCSQCYASKSGCDRVRPRCANCIRRQLKCDYTHSAPCGRPNKDPFSYAQRQIAAQSAPVLVAKMPKRPLQKRTIVMPTGVSRAALIPRRKFTPKQITQLRLREARANRIIREPLYQKAVRDISRQANVNAKAVRKIYKQCPTKKIVIKKVAALHTDAEYRRITDRDDPAGWPQWVWDRKATEDLPGFLQYIQEDPHEAESDANYKWWTDPAHPERLDRAPDWVDQRALAEMLENALNA